MAPFKTPRRFSEFLETRLAEGPQMVTKRGSEVRVPSPSTNGGACRRRRGHR